MRKYPTDSLDFARLAQAIYLPEPAFRLWCHDNGMMCHKWFENAETDTQAAKVVYGGTQVYVFRGTDSVTDWLKNMKIRRKILGDGTHHVYGVHLGFYEALSSIWNDVTWSIKLTSPVAFTGHSLGGALAMLSAYRMIIGLRVTDIKEVITFGQPRMGGYRWASFMDEHLPGRIYRFRNDNDIVTRLPLPIRYKHAGKEVFIDNEGRILPGASELTKLASRVRGRGSNILARLRDFMIPTDGVSDHAMKRYVDALELDALRYTDSDR